MNWSRMVGWFLLAILLTRLLSLGLYPLVDTTEARYAEMARKMLETGNWITPQFQYGVPFWGKPPLSIWLTASSFSWFGVNEFAARLPTFLITCTVVGLTFQFSKWHETYRHALLAALILSSTLLTFVLSGSVLMDPAMTLGTSLSMVAFWRATHESSTLWGLLFFVGLAIGLMAKGPVAVVLVAIPTGLWIVLNNRWALLVCLPWLTGMMVLLALVFPWYLLAESATPGFLKYFVVGEHWERFTDPGWAGDRYGVGHHEPHGMIWLHWLIVALPWSLVLITIAFKTFVKSRLEGSEKFWSCWRYYLLLWCIAPMLFFSLSSNILSTYVLPGIPAMAILCAEMLVPARSGSTQLNHNPTILIPAIGLITPILFLGVLLSFYSEKFELRSEKNLVRYHYSVSKSPSSRLIYVNHRPYSAEFYSHGLALEIPAAEIGQILSDGKDDFIAVRSGALDAVKNQTNQQFTSHGNFGKYVLLEVLK